MFKKWLICCLIFFCVSVILFVSLVDYLNSPKITLLDKEISSFEVVIARYNEDLSWIGKEFPNEKVTVYNKGKDDLSLPKNVTIKKLENIGRESHTYLYHIIENYSRLPERVLFLQGNPFDELSYVFTPLSLYKKIKSTNCKNIIANGCFITSTKRQNYLLSNLDNTKWANTKFKDYDFLEFKTKYIDLGEDANSYFFTNFTANFAVDRSRIIARPKEYYQRIIALLDNIAPIEGHYLERLWGVIFSKES